MCTLRPFLLDSVNVEVTVVQNTLDRILFALRNISVYGVSLTHNFPYEDRIYDSVFIREGASHRKPVL